MNFKYGLVGFFRLTFYYARVYRKVKGDSGIKLPLEQATYFTVREVCKQKKQHYGGLAWHSQGSGSVRRTAHIRRGY